MRLAWRIESKQVCRLALGSFVRHRDVFDARKSSCVMHIIFPGSTLQMMYDCILRSVALHDRQTAPCLIEREPGKCVVSSAPAYNECYKRRTFMASPFITNAQAFMLSDRFHK